MVFDESHVHQHQSFYPTVLQGIDSKICARIHCSRVQLLIVEESLPYHALSPMPALPCINLYSVKSFSVLLIQYQCLKLAQLMIPSETVFGCPNPRPFAWPTTSLSTFFSRFVH